MNPFREFDNRNVQAERRESGSSQRTGGQPTQEFQHAPAAIGWSRSAGSIHTAYPRQSVLSQQGSSSQQQQQGGFSHPQEPFTGGFFPVDTNTHAYTAARSTSPTSFIGTGSSNNVPHLQPGWSARQAPPVAPPNLDLYECRNMFDALDQDRSGQVSREELQCGLWTGRGSKFASRTVDYLMDTFDQDGDGEIGFEEFKHLWYYMAPWQQMFLSFDADQNGRIDANELSQALARYNLRVGSPILNMLMKKYGIKPPQNQHPGYPPRIELDLDHFMCACIVVQRMCELYDKWTETGLGQSPIGRDAFLEAVISLP